MNKEKCFWHEKCFGQEYQQLLSYIEHVVGSKEKTSSQYYVSWCRKTGKPCKYKEGYCSEYLTREEVEEIVRKAT